MLLTDWVRRGGVRVAWLNPTAADADPSRFWRLLVSALSECDGAEHGVPVAMPRGAGIDLVQTLFSGVPESAAQLVVVIDDAHVLTHAEVLEGLDSLIRAGQPGLRLVLAARSDPLLPLHRYRLAGQMRELRAVDTAANRLLGRSGDAPAPAVPGLRAAVLLAQASTHLWHGRHEDVGSLLDEARASGQPPP